MPRAVRWAAVVMLVCALGCGKKESKEEDKGKQKEKPAKKEEPKKEPARAADTSGRAPGTTAAAGKKFSNKLVVWTLGSKLSLTALGYARGVKQQVADRMMERCRIMAKALDTTVPALFTRTGDKTKDSAAALDYVLKTAGRPIGTHIKNKFGPEYLALFEMAMKSNLLHFLYLPSESEKGLSKTIRTVMEQRAAEAKLPEKLYKPLCDKMRAGAPSSQVTEALRKMHGDIKAHLAAGP